MTLWGGRFSTKLNDLAWDLNSSLPVDQRMAIQDVDGSLAWADALHRAGILLDEERDSISHGLDTVKREFSSGEFSFVPSDEDIHTAVERRLTELIGVTSGKLHQRSSRARAPRRRCLGVDCGGEAARPNRRALSARGSRRRAPVTRRAGHHGQGSLGALTAQAAARST